MVQQFPTDIFAKVGGDRCATKFNAALFIMAQTDNKKSWLLGISYKWNIMQPLKECARSVCVDMNKAPIHIIN